MYTRSTTLSFTFPTSSSSTSTSTSSSSFPGSAYRPTARSTKPEVFTFDRVPDLCSRPHRQRRKVMRVMYPSKVRKYLPPAEKSPAKRWLLALCLVLLAQIYSEQADEHDIAEAAALSMDVSGASGSAPAPLFLRLRPAEDSCSNGFTSWLNASRGIEQVEQVERDLREHHVQQRNNGYVMALLYPAVYHKLGSEQ